MQVSCVLPSFKAGCIVWHNSVPRCSRHRRASHLSRFASTPSGVLAFPNRVLVNVEGTVAKAKQITIRVEDKPGSVAEAIRALAGAKVNILSIVGRNDSGTLQLVVDNPRAAKKALDGANVQYSESTAEVVELPNKPGSLLKYLEKLAGKGINLQSIAGVASKKATKAVVVWTS